MICYMGMENNIHLKCILGTFAIIAVWERTMPLRILPLAAVTYQTCSIFDRSIETTMQTFTAIELFQKQ
jgi:hypothetical protein